MADQSRELVPVEPAVAIPTPSGQLVPQWWADAYGPRTMFRTTLDKSDPVQRALLLRSINEDSDTAKSVINLPLRMVGYTISPAGRIDDNGELQQWVRCVIHLDDGRNVACASMGILRSIILIEQLDRPAPWSPPLVKLLKAKDIAGGKQWYYLADPTADAVQSRKGK